jgi:putative IMPACT (imprinted ancient) family translation regulator
MPLLDLIKIKNLDNTLIVVVRYFGGTLLGRGLLTRSYREAASKLFE